MWLSLIHISFSIAQGETMGLVGESGCGKTTVGRTILKLYEATGGSIVYKGTDITGFDDQEMRPYRRKMQMIFQDPYTSLDPRMNVEAIISEPIRALKLCSEGDRRDRVRELIQMVGLKADHLNRYPHEFSGGQRQRIGIARALAAEPEFIVCDEPISALDVSCLLYTSTTVRSRMLYPAELLTHPLFFNSKNYYIYRLDKSQ